MELTAAIEALAALKRPCRVQLYTDSQYVRNGIMEWLPQWKKRGWKTADKKPVKNADLWVRLEAGDRAPRGHVALGARAIRATSATNAPTSWRTSASPNSCVDRACNDRSGPETSKLRRYRTRQASKHGLHRPQDPVPSLEAVGRRPHRQGARARTVRDGSGSHRTRAAPGRVRRLEAWHRGRQRHRRVADRVDGARHRAGRRSHHGAIHVLRDRRNDRADRRQAGLRRHRSAHLQHGSGAAGSGDHAAHQGDHAGLAVRPVRRHRRDQRDRVPATSCRSSRTPRRVSARPTRDAGRAA